MVMIPHDGKSHPEFRRDAVLRVYFRDASSADVKAFELDGTPVYGVSKNDEYTTGINSDWWVWDAEERWYDVIGYEVLDVVM